MSNLMEIRRICGKIFAEVESAEKVFKETLDASDQQMQSARHNIINQDDTLERFILSARSQSESSVLQASRILEGLHLERQQPAEFRVSENVSILQAKQQIDGLLSLSGSILQEIQDKAAILEEERKKWWKIW